MSAPLSTELQSLLALARWFGGLLLIELTADDWAQMAQPERAAALAELGIAGPKGGARFDEDDIAAEFLETFLQPPVGGPLVQSLWSAGSYEGDSAVALRQLAAAADVEFNRVAARAAPVDHLGSILLLWAATREHAPQVAERLVQEHLAWAITPLEGLAAARGETFYAQVCAALAQFVGLLVR